MIGDKFLNVKQAAALIGVSRQTFTAKVIKQLPAKCVKEIGGRTYYNREELEKYFSK
jgi:hypothetical protein